MNAAQYRDHLLKSIPSASIASGGTHINCRCFYCPDSSNPSNKHFYISIPKNETEPSLYYCHKCHASGVVTYKHLIQWNAYDESVAVDLIEHNMNCSKHPRLNKRFMNQNHYIIRSATTTDNEISRIKLDYINNRIGCKFTYEELRSLKIILNLKDLMNDNHIEDLTRDANIVDQLNINFLGFLSIDNAFLNMRRICDEGKVYKAIDKRYINYKLFDKYDTSERFYTIPTGIDTCSPYRIKIHIAEGPFDILSIYKNVRKQEPGIYSCIAGSNYKGQVMYFLENYKLPYVEFHIYPDNDKYGSINKMQYVAEYLRPLNIPLYIHKNIHPGEKDFGVSLDKIQESIMII